MRRRLAALLFVPLTLAALTACSGGDDDAETDPAPETSSSTDDAGTVESTNGLSDEKCAQALAAPELAALAGGELGSYRTTDFSSSIATCQALVSGGDPIDRVGVARASASLWVEDVVPTLDRALAEGDVTGAHRRTLTNAVAKVASGGEVDADRACEVFSVLAEDLQGRAAGSTYVVQEVPRGALDVRTAQACSEGTFTAVTVESLAGLDGDAGLDERLEAAVTAVHPGPVE